MYDFLKRNLNNKVANVLIVIWYVFLGLLVCYFLSAEPGEFRYLNY